MAAHLHVVMGQRSQVLGEEAKVVAHPRHHAAPVRAQQRPVVARLDPGQLLGTGVDAVGDRSKMPARSAAGRAFLAGEGLAGSGNGLADFGGAAACDLTEDCFVDRPHT